MPRAVLVVCGIGIVGCAAVQPVERQALYRSGQLSARRLDEAIRTEKIKTVVNLRGFRPEEPWYREESETCRRNGVDLVDITLDPLQPDRAEMIRLLDTFHTANRPILVHSWSPKGSVGLAAAVYRMAILRESNATARRELAFWEHSHQPIERFRAPDRFVRQWNGEQEFYTDYRLPCSDRHGAPGLNQLGVFEEREKAPVKDSPHSASLGPTESGKLTWGDLNAASERYLGPSSAGYSHRGPGDVEMGTVLRDYSAVLVDGPTTRGPVVIGRAIVPQFGAKRRRATANPDPAPFPAASLGSPIPSVAAGN